MSREELYDEHDRARWRTEPAKRVPAPERTPFERDRARVVHSASLRRLAAKTQVVGPQSDDFVRNRLTHSLEVAQVARDLAHPLGCHPDIAETAALAHDLGHPPFGHNGERALHDLAASCGGFEGNAQTLRILTRLEAKSVDDDGRSLGLNLTRATLDACTKYPWPRERASQPFGHHTDGTPNTLRKFGVYDDDRAVFTWLREGVAGDRRSIEAQVMDFADDVAYSVHDVEDGIVGGKIPLELLGDGGERAAVWETARVWYVPDADDAALDAALDRLRALAVWPDRYDGSIRVLAALKNLTSDLIGIFCGSVRTATRERFGDEPLVRHHADLVIPAETGLEIVVLKSIAAHYVMQAAGRVALMSRQRELLNELHAALLASGPDALDPQFRADFESAEDDGARERVLIDQLASLTDASAETFGVGFSPRGGEDLLRHLRGQGFTDKECVAAGLIGEGRGLYDRFRGRLMWPIRDTSKDTVGFGARRIFDDDRIEAKYLNTPETSLYKKSHALYGIDLARREIARDSQAVIVEGYTDVMACHLSGVKTAVATCGTAFGDDHARIIRRLLQDHDEFRGEVIFTFDGDAAGQKAALREQQRRHLRDLAREDG